MKKLDKLILSSFIGPFILTLLVVIFILLTQYMLRYFDDLVGKDLGALVILKLIFYLSINMSTNAFPLAVLLSSLMTFGNLGEHSELTAVKSSGISLLRVMRPLFYFSVGLALLGFYNNNYLVPKANLEAYSLLYDIKQKKPSMDIKEGTFYSGLSNFSIKVNEKIDDDKLKDIIIYDHSDTRGGNTNVTIADSGRMYKTHHDRYLVLELLNGHNYSQQSRSGKKRVGSKEASPYIRSSFKSSKMMFSLAEFDLKNTDKNLFSTNRIMLNVDQLKTQLDTLRFEQDNRVSNLRRQSVNYYERHNRDLLKERYLSDNNAKLQIPNDKALGQFNELDNGRKKDSISRDMKVSNIESETAITDSLIDIQANEDSTAQADRQKLLANRRSTMDSFRINRLKNRAKILSTEVTIKKADSIETPLNEDNSMEVSSKSKLPGLKKSSKKPTSAKNMSKEVAVSTKLQLNKIDTSNRNLAKSDQPNFSVQADSTQAVKSVLDSLSEELVKEDSLEMDSLSIALAAADTIPRDSLYVADSVFNNIEYKKRIYKRALNQVRYVKTDLEQKEGRIRNESRNIARFQMERYNKYSMAISIIVMFLIGAPLGSIIKKGGLGLPVLLSIIFFIIQYVIHMTADKWARQGYMDTLLASWLSDIVLFPVGLFFLALARKDARLFEADTYSVFFKNLNKRWKQFVFKKKMKMRVESS